MAVQNPRKIHWEPNYKAAVSAGKPDKEGTLTAWKVGVAWLKDQIRLHEEMQAKVADPENYSYFVILVTKGKKPLEQYKDETIIDPEKHRLWIRAFNSPTESMAEDFPPIQWP